jgi:hypothetical protein
MAAPFNEVHSTKKQRLMTRRRDREGNEYIYLKGVASCIAGSWVMFDEAGTTTLLDTDVAASLIGGIAVAQAAVDATTEYGWFMIFGTCSAGAATVADNAKVFASATAGVCDDTGTAGNQIVGAYWRSTDASSLATVQLIFPVSGVNVA